MARSVQDLGVMLKEGRPHRWLALSADSWEELEGFVEAAARKNWQQDPIFSGTDPATGWPAVWVHKPADPDPK